MKKLILSISILLSVYACGDKNIEGTQGDLQTQKNNIEKQIDSLNKALATINKELNQDKTVEIPKIKAGVVTTDNFVHYIELQGNIDTDGNVMVIPEAMGKIVKIYVKEGDRVRKGQTLIRLDDSMIRSQIAEVQTQYSLAKTAYERQKRLWDQKIGSEMAYLQAKTKKQSLASRLHTLRTQLSKMQVKSPISGTLDDLMSKEGEMAAPQKPVARVVNLSKVYMQADVSEKYLANIKKGTHTIISFPETGQQIQANISYVGNFIHPNNRTFKIRINLINTDNSLKPNLTGDIKIKDFEAKNAVVLPLSLVQEDREGNNYVFVLTPDPKEKGVYMATKKQIKLGKAYKDKVMIEEGLEPNDIIAVEAARGLTEGDKIKISNEDVLQNQETAQQATDAEKNIVFHTVKKGETLFRIHKKYKVSLTDLKKWNHLKGNNVKSGQKLIVKK